MTEFPWATESSRLSTSPWMRIPLLFLLVEEVSRWTPWSNGNGVSPQASLARLLLVSGISLSRTPVFKASRPRVKMRSYLSGIAIPSSL